MTLLPIIKCVSPVVTRLSNSSFEEARFIDKLYLDLMRLTPKQTLGLEAGSLRRASVIEG